MRWSRTDFLAPFARARILQQSHIRYSIGPPQSLCLERLDDLRISIIANPPLEREPTV